MGNNRQVFVKDLKPWFQSRFGRVALLPAFCAVCLLLFPIVVLADVALKAWRERGEYGELCRILWRIITRQIEFIDSDDCEVEKE